MERIGRKHMVACMKNEVILREFGVRISMMLEEMNSESASPPFEFLEKGADLPCFMIHTFLIR
jgi:hypothetical protein